ncbi:hypothetical protein ACF0H5_022263 [Mactra antiquata]
MLSIGSLIPHQRYRLTVTYVTTSISQKRADTIITPTDHVKTTTESTRKAIKEYEVKNSCRFDKMISGLDDQQK